jgi:very-short-patch-repair endonuclease
MLAAVLACGEGAVISHGSAAELLGLWERQPALIDVIDRNQAGRKIRGVRWHGVRRPTRDEVAVVDGITCTTASRTLVDLAGGFGERALRRFVEQAAVLRLLNVQEVDRILARGRRRGAACLRAILEPWRIEHGSMAKLRSLLEARLRPALVEADLPRPQCNRVLWIDGRRIEIDLLWEEQGLAIEADGEQTHGTRKAFHSDRKRDQLLVAAGYRVARVTWSQVEREPDAVVGRIRRMLVA